MNRHLETANKKIFMLSVTAVFCAAVIVIQSTLGAITIGQINLNFVLIPIIVASCLYGPYSGMTVGGAFGITVYIQCLTGSQGIFGSTIVETNWAYAIILNIVRGVLIGLVTGVVYRLLSKRIKNKLLTAVIVSAIAPITNTGFFLLIYATLFNGVMHGFIGEGATVFTHLLVTMTGINFIFEVITSAVVSPPIILALQKAFSEKNS